MQRNRVPDKKTQAKLHNHANPSIQHNATNHHPCNNPIPPRNKIINNQQVELLSTEWKQTHLSSPPNAMQQFDASFETERKGEPHQVVYINTDRLIQKVEASDLATH